jgi:hypothetical protein
MVVSSLALPVRIPLISFVLLVASAQLPLFARWRTAIFRRDDVQASFGVSHMPLIQRDSKWKSTRDNSFNRGQWLC